MFCFVSSHSATSPPCLADPYSPSMPLSLSLHLVRYFFSYKNENNRKKEGASAVTLGQPLSNNSLFFLPMNKYLYY
jgi:hypothetical protein